MAIKSKWVTWPELEPYREQLVDMEYELMVKYHYPDRMIPRTYPEKRVANLENALDSGNTFLWITTDGPLLLGYYWAYISSFIDKRRWNLRSIMFADSSKGLGLGNLAIKEGLKKAKELNCDEAATEYVPWNKPMENLMRRNGFSVSRIEVVKELKD